jgi:hypothetical protein
MEEKIVHIPLTHTAPINHNDMPLRKVVHGKDLPEGCRLSKKSQSQRNLSLKNNLPRERRTL